MNLVLGDVSFSQKEASSLLEVTVGMLLALSLSVCRWWLVVVSFLRASVGWSLEDNDGGSRRWNGRECGRGHSVAARSGCKRWCQSSVRNPDLLFRRIRCLGGLSSVAHTVFL